MKLKSTLIGLALASLLAGAVYAAGGQVGEQKTADTPGGPETGKEIDNSKRDTNGKTPGSKAAGGNDAKSGGTRTLTPYEAAVIAADAPLAPSLEKWTVALNTIAGQSLVKAGEPRPAVENVMGGIGAFVDLYNWFTDLSRVERASKARNAAALKAGPGASGFIQVAVTPSGGVTVMQVPSMDTPAYTEPGTTIRIFPFTNPSFISAQPPMSDKDKLAALESWYDSLSADTRTEYAKQIAEMRTKLRDAVQREWDREHPPKPRGPCVGHGGCTGETR